jgi:hypothetical protein
MRRHLAGRLAASAEMFTSPMPGLLADVTRPFSGRFFNPASLRRWEVQWTLGTCESTKRDPVQNGTSTALLRLANRLRA